MYIVPGYLKIGLLMWQLAFEASGSKTVWRGVGEIDVGCEESSGERCINGISFSRNNAESSAAEAVLLIGRQTRVLI